MNKLSYLLLILFLTANLCLAITENDKAKLKANIDETYKYVYYNPAPEARRHAKIYVEDTYFDEYIKCKNNCEVEWDMVRGKTRNNNTANQVFNNCMIKNCNYIKDVQAQECYDFIDEYIELKEKSRKK